MPPEQAGRLYRAWYAKLLRFYPAGYYQRFGQSMEQTFGDLYRERLRANRGLIRLVSWMFFETTIGIIKEHFLRMTTQPTLKRLGMWAMLVAALLMIPLLANWPWSGGDFIFATVLFFGSTAAYELMIRRTRNAAHKLAVAGAVGTPLMLIWVNGAVGIIGSENHDANLLYLGVILIEVIGVAMARFQPRGMSRAMLAAAVAQFLAPFVALIFRGPTFSESPGMIGVFILSTFFAVAFAASGILFQKAANAVQDRRLA